MSICQKKSETLSLSITLVYFAQGISVAVCCSSMLQRVAVWCSSMLQRVAVCIRTSCLFCTKEPYSPWAFCKKQSRDIAHLGRLCCSEVMCCSVLQHKYLCIYIHVYISIHINKYMYIHTYIYVYIYTYTYTHIYICIYLYACIYVFTHIQAHTQGSFALSKLE